MAKKQKSVPNGGKPNTGKRGGARVGAGRKRKVNAKTSCIAVPISLEDKELLKRKGAIKWARDVLVRSARCRSDVEERKDSRLA